MHEQLDLVLEQHAELAPRGHFRIVTPGRTYYLEDASGDEGVAELWVQTICSLQARATPPTLAMTKIANQAGLDSERRSDVE